MKEKDLLKSVSDKNMPDLEKIRQNVLNQTPKKKKPLILSLKPSRLLAVAAIAALALIGTVAAVANQNGGLFAPVQEETTIETVKVTEPTTVKPTIPEKKKSAPKKQKTVHKETHAERIQRYIKRLTNKGFNATWLYDLGKIDGYHIVYAGNNNKSYYKCDYVIGGYTFHSNKQQSPYGLGFYASNEEHSYTLAEAYEKGIFEDFSDVIEKIVDYDEKKIPVSVSQNNSTSNLFMNFFDGRDVFTLAEIKSAENYTLYFNIASSYKKKSAEKTIDDYTFYIHKTQKPYDLGLFIVTDGKILTLEEALDDEILSMDEIYEAVHNDSDVPYNFGLFKDEEEETQETTTAAEENQAADE